MNALFLRLRASPFTANRTSSEFMPALTAFLAELNAIHPFREGNGRTQLAFVRLLSIRAGHPLDLAALRPKAFLAAMIESFAGERSPLENELKRLL